MTRLFAVSALLVSIAVTGRADDKRSGPLTPGATVADFMLKDIHRRPRALADFKDKKAFVVAFIGTECPVANLALPTLIELHKAYADKGVQFLAINSNPQDTFIEVSAHAQERECAISRCSRISTRRWPTDFGAARTPESFVLDDKRVIRYHGRIDDQYGVGFRRDEADAARPERSARRTAGRQAGHDADDAEYPAA